MDGPIKRIPNHHSFDMVFKSMNKSNARNACLTKLYHMEIPLSINYYNSFDVKTNPIIWNWAGFIKMYLKHPHVDDFAFLKGDQCFCINV